MASPDLADVLVSSGRRRAAPIVAAYLARLDAEGYLDAPEPEDAFRTLYGLIVRDTQIAVLLGAAPPSDEEIETHARVAIDRFLVLSGRR